MKKVMTSIWLFFFTAQIFAQQVYHEPYRPQVHFSPKQYWMNDPNGMVYNNGIYHLFFQYYPGASVWGPMHWGHAISTDLIHWTQQPIALYPDRLGYIFSGSCVLDSNNTSGFGIDGNPPLVAIYTNHDTAGENAHTNTYQYQSIAYSNDNGKTWTKYPGNPVVKNPGITDFRDPHVIWDAPEKKWVMALATKDRITFYSSKNLKEWNKESEFGKNIGSHGGVWECPDLFPLADGNKTIWVLIVSISLEAPNGGSGTQYFLGNFDGHDFIPIDSTIRWIDYGPDDYPDVTWNNTGARKIFLGWMSNWLYATKVPTTASRSAMTLPRTLTIQHVNDYIYVASQPVKELNTIETKPVVLKKIDISKSINLSKKIGAIKFPCRIDFKNNVQNFSITLANDVGEKLVIGFDVEKKKYFIDRMHAGKDSFYKGFASVNSAPRLTNNTLQDVTLIIDKTSVELFADGGLTVMTVIFFPDKPYTKILMKGNSLINELEYTLLKSIWK